MKKVFALAFVGMTAALSIQKGEAAPFKQTDKTPCSNLTIDEQEFAQKMAEENRRMFCTKFDARQRKSAMMLACNGPANCGANRRSGKRILTPNESVKKVAKDNRLSMSEKRDSINQEEK